MSSSDEKLQFALDSYCGPLDFLIHLIQKDELQVFQVPIVEIIEQYLLYLTETCEVDMDSGGEFVAYTSSLMLLKSRRLFPEEAEDDELLKELDAQFSIIHHLVDYCRFRDLAKELSKREKQEANHYLRGVNPEKVDKLPGVEHLELKHLSELFADLMERAASVPRGIIEEEEWKVGDKIRWIRQETQMNKGIRFDYVFSLSRSKNELIVSFLALLELMKIGEVSVLRKNDFFIIEAVQELCQTN